MIGRTLVYAVLMVGVAVWAARTVPSYFAARDFAASGDGAGSAATERALPNAGRGQVTLTAGQGGHFYLQATVNGRQIPFVVDTGATTVALTEATARRLNIRPTKAEYARLQTRTANGVVGAAPIVLRRVEVGSISVSNVQAIVIPGDRLGQNLLGMSFLSKLRSYEARGDRLVLVE